MYIHICRCRAVPVPRYSVFRQIEWAECEIQRQTNDLNCVMEENSNQWGESIMTSGSSKNRSIRHLIEIQFYSEMLDHLRAGIEFWILILNLKVLLTLYLALYSVVVGIVLVITIRIIHHSYMYVCM